MPGDPFDIDVPPDAPLRRAAFNAVRPLLSWALQLGTLSDLYRTLNRSCSDTFSTCALRRLEIDVYDEATRRQVPQHGAVVIVANHPHGALDGLALLALVHEVRPDVRLLANHVLARIPELQESCFFIDPFGRSSAQIRSRAGLRAAHRWLSAGGVLIAFPSGEVAHTWSRGALVDSRWRSTTARLAISTGARVVPAFISGHNRRSFYLAGLIHPMLRTTLLPRELLAKRGSRVTVRFGEPLAVPPAGVEADELALRMRAAVEDLAGMHSVGDRDRSLRVPGLRQEAQRGVRREAAAASPMNSLDREIARLPASARLLTSGAFDVYCAERRQLGALMDEIGRLRELAYQSVGEGTGRQCDLDAFDDHYLHLFTWNRERRELAGAYRIGRVDQIIERHGIEGLYTRTLFRYDRRLIDRMAPALELGRSFVRPEYQRNHSALLLLWQGICRFVTTHRQYLVLYGAVSISARYTDMSKQLLMMFLEQNHRFRDAEQLVAAIHPPRRQPGSSAQTAGPASVEQLDAFVARIEVDHKRMPVLLRQYLKLNAQLLGFSVDPSFGDVLDALMMVDLRRVDPSILRRYFGSDAARDLSGRAPASSASAA
jgi:putative hemolysin